MKKAIRVVFNLLLHLGAIITLAWLFWPFVNQAIKAFKLAGFDSEQFIFCSYYFNKFPILPPAGWDHLGYGGTPRVLDTAFLQYYLIQPLVAKLGLSMAAKVYPIIWLGIFFFLSYLVFFFLSKNQFIALALTTALIHSKSTYIQFYEKGIVLSGIGQMAFPLVFLFLILFVQRKKSKYLILGALALAFQFYSHGAMALVLGFTPGLLFLFFSKFNKEKWLSRKKIKRLVSFTLITLAVGALAILPQILNAFKGGTYAKFPKLQVLDHSDIFNLLYQTTNRALFMALGLGLVVTIIFFKKQKINQLIIPLLALLIYILIFQTMTFLGINPIGNLMFPARTVWFFTFILASLAAVFLSPLTPSIKEKGFWPLSFIGILIFGVLSWVVLNNRFDTSSLVGEPVQISANKEERDEELLSFYKKILTDIWDKVDHQDTNVRVWIHEIPKMYWNIVSPVSQAEGYFHFYTKYSVHWDAWLFAVLSAETLRNKTIPQDMAEGQALFLIDWFGIKYLIPYPGQEFDLAPRFWQKNDYILKKSAAKAPAVLTVNPDFTSGIVEAVKVPLVGFVGSDEGYDVFLRDLAMLNLNTHYLVPLRLGLSINQLSKTDLEKIDLLALYNFKGRGQSWEKIADFVKKGGSLFIETGGNSSLGEGINLPEVFPVEQLEVGSLGKDWQGEAKEELSKIDFKEFEPLVYHHEPWKISYVPNKDLVREKGKILLTQTDKPIVVEQQLGAGKVIWSGLNSWYRPWEFKNKGMTEIQLLDVLLKKLLKTSYQPETEIKVDREKPERVVAEGSNFSGVIFKDHYLAGWKAWVETSQEKQSLKIYPAGPDFMYVHLPENLKNKPVKVFFQYRGPLVHWLLFFISIFSIILVVLEIITSGFLSKKFKLYIFDPEKLFKKISGWWEKEDDV